MNDFLNRNWDLFLLTVIVGFSVKSGGSIPLSLLGLGLLGFRAFNKHSEAKKVEIASEDINKKLASMENKIAAYGLGRR